MRVCLPVYNPKPMDPDVIARTRLRLEVGNHFFRNEGLEVDLFPELPNIRCPTLVLGGELDPITPVADSQDIAAAIPQAEVRIFEGAGHGVFRDQPEEAVEVIREFVLR
jgi:pimeloyl-ACP methyl ester carboxylesterase